MSVILRFAFGGALFMMLMAAPGRADAFDHIALSVIGMAIGLTMGATGDAEPETPAEPAASMEQPTPPVPVAGPPGNAAFTVAGGGP